MPVEKNSKDQPDQAGEKVKVVLFKIASPSNAASEYRYHIELRGHGFKSVGEISREQYQVLAADKQETISDGFTMIEIKP